MIIYGHYAYASYVIRNRKSGTYLLAIYEIHCVKDMLFSELLEESSSLFSFLTE